MSTDIPLRAMVGFPSPTVFDKPLNTLRCPPALYYFTKDGMQILGQLPIAPLPPLWYD